MTVTTMEVRSKLGEIRLVQWVGDGPHLVTGDRVEALGTTTWESGKSCNIAWISFLGGKIFPSLRSDRFTIWEGVVDINVGDEIMIISRSSTMLADMVDPDRPRPTPEKLMAEHAAIFNMCKQGDYVSIEDKLL